MVSPRRPGLSQPPERQTASSDTGRLQTPQAEAAAVPAGPGQPVACPEGATAASAPVGARWQCRLQPEPNYREAGASARTPAPPLTKQRRWARRYRSLRNRAGTPIRHCHGITRSGQAERLGAIGRDRVRRLFLEPIWSSRCQNQRNPSAIWLPGVRISAARAPNSIWLSVIYNG